MAATMAAAAATMAAAAATMAAAATAMAAAAAVTTAFLLLLAVGFRAADGQQTRRDEACGADQPEPAERLAAGKRGGIETFDRCSLS
jgi:hypothetical protein